MPQKPPTGSRVRVRRIVAGSFIAAVSAASTAGLAAPAEAGTSRTEASVFSPAAPVSPAVTHRSFATPDSFTGHPTPVVSEPAASPVSAVAVSGPAASASSGHQGAERLRAVRAELDSAVAFHLVTAEQADDFFAQIERRVVAGL